MLGSLVFGSNVRLRSATLASVFRATQDPCLSNFLNTRCLDDKFASYFWLHPLTTAVLPLRRPCCKRRQSPAHLFPTPPDFSDSHDGPQSRAPPCFQSGCPRRALDGHRTGSQPRHRVPLAPVPPHLEGNQHAIHKSQPKHGLERRIAASILPSFRAFAFFCFVSDFVGSSDFRAECGRLVDVLESE